MSFLSGIMKSIINPATLMQLAMGPAGWASLAMKTIATAIAQQLIQQLGQQLGLPPAVINMAQSAFSAASGTQGFPSTINEAVAQMAEQFNLSPSQQGELSRAAEFDLQSLYQGITKAGEFGKQKAQRGRTNGSGGSWLRVIAEALAKQIDSKVEEMRGLAVKMDGVKHEKGKTDSTQIQTDLQVATQEFSMLMQSTANIIKTIGEGLGNMARKG